MTYFELKKHITKALLPQNADCADFEAGKIICHSAEIDSARLFARLSETVPDEITGKCENIMHRRLSGEPLEYIIGSTVFYGLTLKVTPDVLIPRADTEAVCEKTLAHLKKNARIADICCGSGNIALALLSKSDAVADLFDYSEKALRVARENVKALGYENRARIFRRDVFSDGFFDGTEKYDLIISNPPYIKTQVIDTLSPEVKREPHMALDGGEDGLLFYRRLLEICPAVLNENGVIVFEIGFDQSEEIAEMCKALGYSCELFRDYGGNFRGCVVKV